MRRNKPLRSTAKTVLLSAAVCAAMLAAYHFGLNRSADTAHRLFLRDSINATAPLRTGIAEYLAANGRLPDKLSDLHEDGLPPARYISEIEMKPGSVLVLRLNRDYGLKGSVTLTPVLMPDNGGIAGWRCESNEYSLQEADLPLCM